MLKIEDLKVALDADAGLVRAIDGMRLAITRGQTFALVGESGCGKSMTALALMRLLPDNGRITGFRLVEGSWKIMPMRPPRTERICASGRPNTSSPSRSRRPAVMRPLSGSRRIRASAVMLLPQPDSPTSANVSPRSMLRRMPSIARTRPASASSATFRSSIFSMAHSRLCLLQQRQHTRAQAAGPRVEGITHAIGEQIGRQHQGHHETECGREAPPHDRVA
jgi:ABC-type dipeptide/oligopeptide/nickel transport system ATPase component